MDKLYKNIVNDYVTLKKLDNNYKITHVGGNKWEDNIKKIFDLFIYTNPRASINYKRSNYSYYRVREAFLNLGRNDVFMNFINSSAKNSIVIIDSLNFAKWEFIKSELNYLIDLASYSISSIENRDLKNKIIKNLWGQEKISEGTQLKDLRPLEKSIIYKLRQYSIKNRSIVLDYTNEKKDITDEDMMQFTINFFHLISIINKGETNFVIVHSSDVYGDEFIRSGDNYNNVYILLLHKFKRINYPPELMTALVPHQRRSNDINLNEIDDIACVILLYIIYNLQEDKKVSIMTRDNYTWSNMYPNIQLYFQKLNVHGLLDESTLHKLNLPGIINFGFKYNYKTFHNIITENKTLITIEYNGNLIINHSADVGHRTRMIIFNRV